MPRVAIFAIARKRRWKIWIWFWRFFVRGHRRSILLHGHVRDSSSTGLNGMYFLQPSFILKTSKNKTPLRKSIGVWSFTRYHPNSAKTPSEVSDKTRHITLPDGSPYTSADFEAVDSGMSYTSASRHRSQQTRLSWARRCRSCFLHSLCIWIISNLGILSRVGKPISGYSSLMYI